MQGGESMPRERRMRHDASSAFVVSRGRFAPRTPRSTAHAEGDGRGDASTGLRREEIPDPREPAVGHFDERLRLAPAASALAEPFSAILSAGAPTGLAACQIAPIIRCAR